MSRRRRAWLAAAVVAAAAACVAGGLRSGVGVAPGAAHAQPPSTAPDPGLPASPIESAPRVVDYELEAVLDPDAHTVAGTGTVRWTNASSVAVDHLFVHLYMNAFANDATVFRRERVSGFRGNVALDTGNVEVTRFFVKELGRDVWPEAPHTPGDPNDATDIRVPLGRAVEPGETITIELAFKTKLPSVALRAGYAGSFHMVAQWFPKIAKLEPDGSFAHFPYERLSEFYADFGSYRVTVDTPEAFVVGATGVEVASVAAGGRIRRTFEQIAVHDFAFAAWNHFREKTAEAEGVKIRCLYPPTLDAAADVEIAAAARGLAFFGRVFGAYPYETLTIVHPPADAAEAGGMEYPTLITTGGPFWAAHVPVLYLEHLTLHELAHQWFYGLVATNENAFPFLDEGLTTYATGEGLRDAFGYTVTPLVPLEIEAIDRATRIHLSQAAPLSSRASGFATGGDYGGLVYARTATILRTIDRVWDGAARRALGAFAREHRYRHPGPADLERAIREAGGDAAGALFHQAVHERGWVDFEPAFLTSTPRDEGGFISRVTVRRRGTIVVPVEVEVFDDRGKRATAVWDGRGDFARLEVSTEGRAVSVLVDPANRVLIDEDRTNDALKISPHGFAPRATTLAALLAGLALTVASP